MARILVVSLPFAGHAGPMSAVAAELVRRGHEVVAYTGAKYHERFTKAGARWLPWERATDFDDANLAATFPKVGDGKGQRGGQANVKYVLFGTAAGQVADIRAAAADEPFDLVVTDQLAFGAAIAGEALAVPWITVAVTPLNISSRDLPPLGPPPASAVGRAGAAVMRGVASAASRLIIDPMLNKVRASAGLGPAPAGRVLDELYSPLLVIAQGAPGALEYPRSDLPAHVRFVGRLAPPAAGGADALPDWWPEVAAARCPVVHVTQGTLDVDPADLLRPALAGLAAEPVLVVATTGGAPLDGLGTLPANARASAFLPHDRLLPLTDVMITNGGWGGVLAAVQAGVPLIVAGDSLDKPEVARRVAWSGAGINLRTGRPQPSRVAAAVREITAQTHWRERTRELGAALDAAGGLHAAADLIEEKLNR
jgi:MGT family glycosyltransferase